jgi:hypothetical protein
LEQVVWDQVRTLLQEPRRVADEYRRRVAQARDGAAMPDEVIRLDRQMTSLRRGIGRLIDSYTEGVIDKTEFEPRIAGLKQRVSQLQERHQTALQAAETERDLALVISRLEDFSAKVTTSIDNLDRVGMQEIIRSADTVNGTSIAVGTLNSALTFDVMNNQTSLILGAGSNLSVGALNQLENSHASFMGCVSVAAGGVLRIDSGYRAYQDTIDGLGSRLIVGGTLTVQPSMLVALAVQNQASQTWNDVVVAGPLFVSTSASIEVTGNLSFQGGRLHIRNGGSPHPFPWAHALETRRSKRASLRFNSSRIDSSN